MSRGTVSLRSTFPLLGVHLSAMLAVVAAAGYPGGGYDWFDQSISSLFQPIALDGSHNTSRSLAVLAMFIFCSSIAIIFNMIANCGPSRLH